MNFLGFALQHDGSLSGCHRSFISSGLFIRDIERYEKGEKAINSKNILNGCIISSDALTLTELIIKTIHV